MESGWFSLAEYAKKCELPIDQVVADARGGRLGPIVQHPTTGEDMVIWPPEMQSKLLAELPPVGRYSYRAVLSVQGQPDLPFDPSNIDQFERIQKTYLFWAHSLGKPKEVATRSEELLYQSGVLLQWTAFEVFLRGTIQELIKRNPRAIASGATSKASAATFEEIIEMSNNFSSIESLRERLVQKEIEKQQSRGESVHGLINFLKNQFELTTDPYAAHYVFKGVAQKAGYEDLMEVKDVKNALIHSGGTPPRDFYEKYPEVPRREGSIVMNKDYYLKCSLVLGAIAHTIAKGTEEPETPTDVAVSTITISPHPDSI